MVAGLLDEAEATYPGLDWDLAEESARVALGLNVSNEEAHAILAAVVRMKRGSVAPPTDAPPVAPQPETDNPRSFFANGRCTVMKFLGEGGKKQVCLAQDKLHDREAEFALINAEGLDDVARIRTSLPSSTLARIFPIPPRQVKSSKPRLPNRSW